MKKIVCELCESTEFTKEGGFFICQGCGTKYSLEEAKAMMREVEGSAPVSTGVPGTAAPMGNPNQQQIDNILVLATTAYEAQNYAEVENYCNQALILDAMCYKAWNLKGKAVGWQSNLGNLRIEEASHSFCQAIDFAPEEEKDELKTQAVEELKNLGLSCISLRKDNFAKEPSTSNLNGFINDRVVLIKAITVLLTHGNAVGMPEGYTEEIANMMNNSAVAALESVRNAWKVMDHPSDEDLSTYLDWLDNIESLIRQAIDACDDDDEEDIVRYNNLAIVLEDPIGMHSYERYWDSTWSEFKWRISQRLTEKACNIRRKKAQEARDKAKELKKKVEEKKAAEARKAEEEKQARIKAYWEAHADEKEALEAEKKELEEKSEKLSSEISAFESQIDTKVSTEEEIDKLKDQIKDLEARKSKLGLFAGKEKKQISSEIATLQGRIDALKPKAEEERKVKNAPLTAKRDELKSDLDKAKKRIAAIDAEFSKDPKA